MISDDFERPNILKLLKINDIFFLTLIFRLNSTAAIYLLKVKGLIWRAVINANALIRFYFSVPMKSNFAEFLSVLSPLASW